MADLIFVALVLAFFGLAVLLVQACDHIIGPDPAPDPSAAGAADETGETGGADGAVIDLDAGELAAW